MKKQTIIRAEFAGVNTIICCDGSFKDGKASVGYVRVNNQVKISDGFETKSYHPNDIDSIRGSAAAELLAATQALEKAPHNSTLDFYSDSDPVINFINEGTIPRGLQADSQFDSIYWRLQQAIDMHRSITAKHKKQSEPSIKQLLNECHDLAAKPLGVKATFENGTKNQTSKSKRTPVRWPPKIGNTRKRRPTKSAQIPTPE